MYPEEPWNVRKYIRIQRRLHNFHKGTVVLCELCSVERLSILFLCIDTFHGYEITILSQKNRPVLNVIDMQALPSLASSDPVLDWEKHEQNDQGTL